MKSQVLNYVEIKRVTWSKDSHGLFDYESKNVNFSKDKIEASSKVFKNESDILIKPIKEDETQQDVDNPNYLFSLIGEGENNEKFILQSPPVQQYDSNKQNLFLIVRSLKNEQGVQRGYSLELGDIIRLGRIEYKVIEYQDHQHQRYSLYDLDETQTTQAHNLTVKTCFADPSQKHQCRICLMDEHEGQEILVNPCNCKGTSEYVHITCLQSWINSKAKNKVTNDSSSWSWKHLNCEICKTSLPDLLKIGDSNFKLLPTMSINRPKTPYMLVERIFYDRSKGGENSKMLILLSITNESHQIKLGRGHDCDIRENDISVSRLHAYIKYQDNKFVIVDNNSKFGTLVLLRKGFEIEKRKIAVQIGRTVITFSVKQQQIVNSGPQHKNPLILEKQFQKKILPESNELLDQDLKEFDMNDGDINGDFE